MLPKIMVPPKVDGENNGKPHEQMDDLGIFPLFLETPTCFLFSGFCQVHFLGWEVDNRKMAVER